MLPCVSRYAVAAIRPDPAVPSRRGDHARAEILATPTQIAHRVFPGSGTKTQETPRQRHDRGTLHGRPPFLTSTLPADPRFSAPQNPARVVGSGYIQFPPQRPFAGPLLTQPPTVSVRDPRSAKRSASKSSAIPVASRDAPRDARGDSHGACRPRVEQMHLDAATDERARAPPSRLDLRPSDCRLPPRARRLRRYASIRARTTTAKRLPRGVEKRQQARGSSARARPSPAAAGVLRPASPPAVPAALPAAIPAAAAAAAVPAIRPGAAAAVPATLRPAVRPAPRWPAAGASRAQPVRRRSGAGHGAAAAAEADGAGEPARDACAEGTEAGAEEPRGGAGDGAARRARAAARRAARARGARAAETPEDAPRRDRRDAGGTPARGARGAETPPGVGDPRRAIRRARLEVAGEAQPEEAPRSRRGVTRDVPTSRRPPRDVKTFTREPLRAREAARAKPRRSTNVLRRSALRRSGGEKPNRLGEDEAENPKTQKPKNPKTQKRRSARLDGPRSFEGAIFTPSLVRSSSKTRGVSQVRTARAFVVAIRRRRIGAARINLFSRVVRSRHRRNSAAETGRVSL